MEPIQHLDIQHPTVTIWENQTTDHFRFKLFVRNGDGADGSLELPHSVRMRARQPAQYLMVDIPPKRRISLPSEYDQGIQTVRKVEGEMPQVVGGLCPRLTKIGQMANAANPQDMIPAPEVSLPAAFDPRASAEADAMAALGKQDVLRQLAEKAGSDAVKAAMEMDRRAPEKAPAPAQAPAKK